MAYCNLQTAVSYKLAIVSTVCNFFSSFISYLVIFKFPPYIGEGGFSLQVKSFIAGQ